MNSDFFLALSCRLVEAVQQGGSTSIFKNKICFVHEPVQHGFLESAFELTWDEELVYFGVGLGLLAQTRPSTSGKRNS
jgi:hypothetical protein